MADTSKTFAIQKLQRILANVAHDPELQQMISARDDVFAHYQPMFAVEQLDALTADQFKSFLLSQNNHHWSGLHRGGPAMTNDMGRLREGLRILLDESVPIENRIDRLIPMYNSAFVPKLGKATATAILHVAHPDKYAVYNGTSESALDVLGMMPDLPAGSTTGDYYVAINELCHELAAVLQVDLWTLDGLWWRVRGEDAPDDQANAGVMDTPAGLRFGLEKQLQFFLADNWANLDVGKEWDLYEKDGDIAGVEFDTREIGRIDLLAKHKNDPRWLVVEIKRDQTSDDTVGQALRYMGWVQENLAKQTEKVEGLIIAASGDQRINYALRFVPQVRMMCYKIHFQLAAPEEME